MTVGPRHGKPFVGAVLTIIHYEPTKDRNWVGIVTRLEEKHFNVDWIETIKGAVHQETTNSHAFINFDNGYFICISSPKKKLIVIRRKNNSNLR